MMEQFNYCLVVGQTDVGRKRAANEDNMGNAITINGLVSVVCDGMGGHVGGATASKIAVNAILENLNTNYYDDPRIAIGESIDIANSAILNEAAAHPELSGMGSTCVLLIVRNGKVYIGHVGDSRIYLIRSRRIVQLTKDHSYVQMLVDKGEITKEQAEHHPRKNEITNALGIPNMAPATVADDAIVPEAGDCFLLCSDGLSGMVPDATINKVISRQSEMNAQERINRLVSIANENGGVDNITAQMVEFTVSPESIKQDEKFPLWLKTLVSVLVIVAVGVGVYFCFKPQKDYNGGNAVRNIIKNIETVNIPNKIKYKEHGECVTLVFTDSDLTFKHTDKQIYKHFADSLEISTLQVTPYDCIDTRNINEKTRMLVFYKEPKEKVIVSLSSKGGQKYQFAVYDPAVKIDEESVMPSSKTSDTKKEIKPQYDTIASRDTIKKEELGEHTLSTEAKLIFNYSAKPCFKLGEHEKFIEGVLVSEIIDGKISFDNSCWRKDFNPTNCQLIFIYNGCNPKSTKQTFRIPCRLKGSNEVMILEVTLTIKNDGNKGSDNQPVIEDDASQATEDSTANQLNSSHK